MKKKFLALITAAVIGAPTLFAFHDEDTGLLTAGMPVVYMVSGFKFTPQQHSEARAACRLYMLQNAIYHNASMQIYS